MSRIVFSTLLVLLTAAGLAAPAEGQLLRAASFGDGPSYEMSRALATGGDVNGDGRNDFVVGARGTATSTFPGKAYVFSGTGSPLHVFWGQSAGDEFGSSIAIVDDVNGDGFDDILIGARSANGSAGADVGMAYLFQGETPGHTADYALIATFEGAAAGDALGASVANVGDADGDGMSDFVIGAPHTNQPTQGQLYLYSGATLSVVHVYTSGQGGDALGWFASAAGDVDQDGFADVFVSAINYDGPGGVDAGRAFAFRGQTPGHVNDYALIHAFDGEHPSARFGVAIGGGSDVTGDGVPDFIVGSNLYNAPGFPTTDHRGRAYAYSGAGGTLIWLNTGVEDRDWYGVGVAMAGDIDADGRNEIIVGACQTEKGGKGKAYLHNGATGAVLFEMIGESASGIPHQGDAFGFSVAGADDLDFDGAAEFLVGAYGVDGWGGVNSGKVYLFSSATRCFATDLPPPHVLTLRLAGWPKLGTGIGFLTTGGPPGTLGLLGLSPALESTPFFGGTILLQVPGSVLVPYDTDATGLAGFGVALTTDVAFLGLTMHAQAAMLDLSQPQWVAFSNGLTVTTY